MLLFIFILLHRPGRNYNTYSLTGGNTEFKSEGFWSYCEVDDDKFIKYYFELKNTNYPQHKEVIDDKIITFQRLTESDMYKHIMTFSNKLPKLYKAYDIPFDENIFNKIHFAKYYSPDEVQMKVLITEYCKDYISLRTWFKEHPNVDAETMINIYSQVFDIVINLIKHKVFPRDLENITNFIIDDHLNIRNIDCAEYELIKTDYDINKLFTLWVYHSCIEYNRLRPDKSLFTILRRHQHKEDIIKSITNNQLVISYILNWKYHRTYTKICKSLLGDNDVYISSLRNLYKLYLNNEYEEIYNKGEQWLTTNNYTNKKLTQIRTDDDELHQLFSKLKELDTYTREYIISKLYKYTIKDLLFDFAWIVEVTGNKLLKLTPGLSTRSFKSSCLGDVYGHKNTVERTNTYFFGNYIRSYVEFIPNEELIYPFDTYQKYILNWVGNTTDINSQVMIQHYPTYNVFRLMCLDIMTYKEVTHDAKFMPIEQFHKYHPEYKDVYECVRRSINIENEFKLFLDYITKNLKKYEVLYRGERRHTNSGFIYPNIHTYTNSQRIAKEFMTNEYFKYDDQVIEYNLYTIYNTSAVHIKSPIFKDNKCVYWDEYLHLPCKYKVVDKTVEDLLVKYPDGEHTITVNYITLEEE